MGCVAHPTAFWRLTDWRAIQGFGFDNAHHTPELVHSITQFFRDTTPGGVYLVAGTPASWRTAEGDADRNPDFLNVWMSEFDAISPWTVGRYSNDQEADQFMETKMKGDVELITQHNEKGVGRKIDYIPVVLPGGSVSTFMSRRYSTLNLYRDSTCRKASGGSTTSSDVAAASSGSKSPTRNA